MSVTFDFTGTAVVVTGATSGIGHAVARAFANAGAEVIGTGTRAAADEYEVDLDGIDYRQLQLHKPEQLDGFAASLDRLDVLVNNAGQNLPGGLNEWEPAGFEASVAINLTAPFRLSTACLDLLRDSRHPGGAAVVNLASLSSLFASTMVPGYGAAKTGVLGITRTLGAQWAEHGIRVNAVAPGLIDTQMTAPMKPFDTLVDPMIERTPMRRWGQPDDLVGPILFLASEAAGFITGQVLAVDGGYSIS